MNRVVKLSVYNFTSQFNFKLTQYSSLYITLKVSTSRLVVVVLIANDGSRQYSKPT